MSKTAVEVYFEYLEDVLGIKQVLFDRQPEVTSQLVQIPILISVLNLKNYKAEENELLYKMIAALKLPPENYVVIDADQISNYEAKAHLSLVDEPIQSQNPQTIQTYSARKLLSHPDLKRQAWTEMQKLLQLK